MKVPTGISGYCIYFIPIYSFAYFVQKITSWLGSRSSILVVFFNILKFSRVSLMKFVLWFSYFSLRPNLTPPCLPNLLFFLFRSFLLVFRSLFKIVSWTCWSSFCFTLLPSLVFELSRIGRQRAAYRSSILCRSVLSSFFQGYSNILEVTLCIANTRYFLFHFPVSFWFWKS